MKREVIVLVDDRGGKHDAYIDSKGVIRWVSNNAVPFQEMLAYNKFDQDVLDLCAKVRDEECFTILTDYRKRMKNHVHSAEEMSEMRAAFGPDCKEVVNVITGRRTKL